MENKIKALVNESVFENEDNNKNISNTVNKKNNQNNIDAPQEDIKSQQEKMLEELNKPIEEVLKDIKKTKEDVYNAILQLIDKGFYEEEYSFMDGKLKFTFKSPLPATTDAVYAIMEDKYSLSLNRFDFIYNLLTISSILTKYKNNNLNNVCLEKLSSKNIDIENMSPIEKEIALMKCKSEYIESEIPLPIYQIINQESSKFHKFIYILGREDIMDFLS